MVDEAVLNRKAHTMDSWLIPRLSFPKESTSAFFLLQTRLAFSKSQSGLGNAVMSIWNFLSSLEMILFRVDHWLGCP